VPDPLQTERQVYLCGSCPKYVYLHICGDLPFFHFLHNACPERSNDDRNILSKYSSHSGRDALVTCMDSLIPLLLENSSMSICKEQGGLAAFKLLYHAQNRIIADVFPITTCYRVLLCYVDIQHVESHCATEECLIDLGLRRA
jgi:hypothetical protein